MHTKFQFSIYSKKKDICEKLCVTVNLLNRASLRTKLDIFTQRVNSYEVLGFMSAGCFIYVCKASLPLAAARVKIKCGKMPLCDLLEDLCCVQSSTTLSFFLLLAIRKVDSILIIFALQLTSQTSSVLINVTAMCFY